MARPMRAPWSLTGFAVTNPQHSVNGPTYGLDNSIQLAYSGGGGALIYPSSSATAASH